MDILFSVNPFSPGGRAYRFNFATFPKVILEQFCVLIFWQRGTSVLSVLKVKKPFFPVFFQNIYFSLLNLNSKKKKIFRICRKKVTTMTP